MFKCKDCGKEISLKKDYYREINCGLPDEYILCESCFESRWEESLITSCISCGEWFDTDRIANVATGNQPSFAPCPLCGKDVVEGFTRQEWEAEMKKDCIKGEKKTFELLFTEHVNHVFYVEAENAEEAEETFYAQLNAGEIDFSDGTVYDSNLSVVNE